MSLLQKLIGAALRPRVRRKARSKNLSELVKQLEASRDRLLPRIDAAADTPGNREAINHWIGIERWSLSRIRVAQGEPFEDGSYHPFRLPDTASLRELQAGFRAARSETLALARELERDGFDRELKIRHNDLGELTVTEWFAYVDDHTTREIVRLRGGT